LIGNSRNSFFIFSLERTEKNGRNENFPRPFFCFSGGRVPLNFSGFARTVLSPVNLNLLNGRREISCLTILFNGRLTFSLKSVKISVSFK